MSRGLWSVLAAQKGGGPAEPIRNFVNGLNTCKNLVEIRDLAVGLHLDLRSTPRCSQLAFDRMIRVQCRIEKLIQFLEDSLLNAPEAQNLHSLLQWQMQQESDKCGSERLHRWIKRQVSLGLLRGPELSLLLDKLSSANETVNLQRALSFSQTIFEGLCSSTAFAVHDVDPSVLSALLTAASSSLMSPNGRSLGIAVMERSSPSQLQHMKSAISSFLKRCLLPPDGDHTVQRLDSDTVSKMLKLLQRAPISLEFTVIASVSRALLTCREPQSSNRSIVLKNLNSWWSLLQSIGTLKLLSRSDEWVTVERRLARKQVEILALYLRLLDDEQICCFLLRNWFIPEIYHENFRSFGSRHPIEERFGHHLSLTDLTRVSPFVTMLQCLGSELPASSKWILPLFSLLRVLERSSIILEIVKLSQELELSPISRTAIVVEISEQAKLNPHIAYRLFSCIPNIPLEACPAVARVIIRNPRFDPYTAHQYRLTRQKSLTLSSLFVPNPVTLDRGFRGIYPKREHPQIRESRVRLFEHMAIAYAEAPHLHPRVAYRNVLWCHRLFKWYCLGPLSVDMSRALVVAGVVRQLQECKWVSTMKVRWILGVVRAVEGEEVAGQLDEMIYAWRTQVVKETSRNLKRERSLREIGMTLHNVVRKRPRGGKNHLWLERP